LERVTFYSSLFTMDVMGIKIMVDTGDRERVKRLGARWVPDARNWVIPDGVPDINSFREWLPDEEGYIVQRPYFIMRTNRLCTRCGKETPLVALGAKYGYKLGCETTDKPLWKKWGFPILFTGIVHMDEEILKSMQDHYPFFQWSCSSLADEGGDKYRYFDSDYFWANTCVHCKAVQEDEYNFIGEDAPFRPRTLDEARELRVVCFKLGYDYYVQGKGVRNWLYGGIV
jgi:hypothetical protein